MTVICKIATYSLLANIVLVACDSGKDEDESNNLTTYTIGGTISGLGAGKTLVLQNNGGDDLTATSDGTFTFATALADGRGYDVQVETQPAGQTCTASNNSGTIAGASVTGISVTCSTNTYAVGGVVTGLENGGLTLQNNGSDDLAVSADGPFTFSLPISDDDPYSVTVSTHPTNPSLTCTVINGSGTVTGADVTSVTVKCRGWRNATRIEADDTGPAIVPRIAFDPVGNAIAVWRQRDPLLVNDSIWFNRYAAGSGWGVAQQIETDNMHGSLNPALAVDSGGNFVAAWGHLDGTRVSMRASRYTPAGGWSAPEYIGADEGGDAEDVRVAADSLGNAIAVWHQSDGTRTNIWANRYAPASGWGAAQLIEHDDAGSAAHVQIAVDSADDAIAVWQQSNGAYYDIWASRYVAGEGWSTPVLLEDDDGGAYHPKLAFDAERNAIAVWLQFTGTHYNLRSTRYTANVGWGTVEVIADDGTFDTWSPELAVDAAGNAIVVWYQSDGTRENIWSTRYTAESGWEAPTLIEHDDAGNASIPLIAMDSDGNAIAAWTQLDGGYYTPRANYYTAGAGWGSAIRLECDDTGGAASPLVAFDPAGNALAVWSQSDGTRNNIWANRY